MKTCKDNNGIAAFATKALESVTGLPKNSRKKTPQTPLGNNSAFTHLFRVMFDVTPGRCYSGMESKFQPFLLHPQCLMESPHPRSWTPQYLFGLGFTVPVMVMSSRGTSPACRGSSKGTFWETKGIWCQQKIMSGAKCHPWGQPAPGPSRGQAKSATEETETLKMMEPLPLEESVLPEEELVLPAEQKAQIQGHWMVVLGWETAPSLLALQGMLQVLLDTLLVLLVLQDKLQVLQGTLQVLQGMLQVLQGMLLVLLVLQGMLLVLQDRPLVLRDTLGMPQELWAGSPRRASPGLGGHRGPGCCCWPRRRITGDRGEDKGQEGEIPPGIMLSSPASILCSLQRVLRARAQLPVFSRKPVSAVVAGEDLGIYTG